MNKIISFCVLAFFVSTNVYSYIWTRTLGGTGNDCGYSICFVQDTGYILAGYTESQGAGMTDGWLIKTDTFGIPIWNKTFGGTDSDCIYSVTKTMDSGYIMTGYTKSFGAGGSDVWFIKTDASGDTIWTRTYGDSNNECAYSIINAIDSGYVAIGTRNSGKYAWLLKVNTNGDTLWTKIFQRYGRGRCVQPTYDTYDSGYIITGYSDSLVYAKTASWLIKIDANGDTLWTKAFGTYNCRLYSVIQTKDIGYIMTGTETIDTYNTLWVVKTDFLGNEIPNYAVWGIVGTGYSIAETNSGDYIIVGSGNTVTSPPFYPWDDDYTNSFEGCYADSDGAIIVKTNKDYGDYGDRLGYFGGKYANGAYSFLQTPDSAYVMVGYTDSYGEGKRDLWLIRTEKNAWEGRTPAIEENSSDKNSFTSISVSPNPITSSAKVILSCNSPKTIKLTLYDISGREKMCLLEGSVKTKNTLTFNTSSLASGKYFLKMEADGKRIIKGITILK
ncbi:MAG: T9SS type A sorting domain-containing protein [bacterium]|nr:T9SS type A sorting domain-containing protein [bacterium]